MGKIIYTVEGRGSGKGIIMNKGRSNEERLEFGTDLERKGQCQILLSKTMSARFAFAIIYARHEGQPQNAAQKIEEWVFENGRAFPRRQIPFEGEIL